MTNAPQQIGQYHVQSELGRGGMVVVYLANDSRLDRQVAIKALPAEVTVDAERLARFEREARTLAQLNHPNLAGIHGVEVDGDQRFLVLEYVEGETLADVLERGPLPVDEALQVCAQIAAGVESAHDGGVIHRDLKPANIKITPDGKVKVLDFGLAKSSDPVSSTTNSQFPTVTTPNNQQSHTIEGAILGTAPYMSPEQARGRRVDRRSDVWSFGCILYECLTGARLFAGESATDSMGAILHKEIDFSLLPRETPARVRELLSRLLERDKERRLRDLGDAMLELEAARGEPGAAQAEAGSVGNSGPGWPIALAMVALAAVATGVVMLVLRPIQSVDVAAAPPHPTFMNKQLTDNDGMELWPTLTPDGSTVVFAAMDGGDYDIFTRRVDGLNATNLTSDHGGHDGCPALSPDGRYIAFASERGGGGLFVMGATGESPRRLTSSGADPCWSPDGTRIVYATELIQTPLSRMSMSELWVVNVNTGDAERIYKGDAVQPAWSPSGERIAFWRVQANGQRDLFTIAADGADLRPITEDAPTDWRPVWSPDGRWLYFSSDRGGGFGIWRIAIDQATGATNGEPQQITTGGADRAVPSAFSADGSRLAYAAMNRRTSLLRQDLNKDTGQAVGSPRVISAFTTLAGLPSISSDGRYVAYSNIGERQEDLYIINSDGTRRRRITNDAAKDRGPIWTPDGARLLFYSDRDGMYRIWSIRTDGGGLVQVTDVDVPLTTPALSPDGSLFAARSTVGDNLYVFEIEADGKGTQRTLPDTPQDLLDQFPMGWAADSKRLLIRNRSMSGHNYFAILNMETGEYESDEIESYGLLREITVTGTAGFSPDDKSVLAIRDSKRVVKIDFESGEETIIYEPSRSGATIDQFDLARDGSWIVVLESASQSDLWMLDFQHQ